MSKGVAQDFQIVDVSGGVVIGIAQSFLHVAEFESEWFPLQMASDRLFQRGFRFILLDGAGQHGINRHATVGETEFPVKIVQDLVDEARAFAPSQDAA